MTSHQGLIDDGVAMVRPAGFWRRVLALSVDAIVVGSVIALLGALLFAPTGGAVRVAGIPVLSKEACASVALDRYALRLPADFNVTSADVCTGTAFGIVHDHRLELRDVRQTGMIAVTRTMTFPLGPDGRLTRPLYLDFAGGLVLVVYLLLSEWRFGTSLGKLLMGVWVRPLEGDRLSFAASCRRLLRFAPLVPFVQVMALTLTGDPVAEWAFWESYGEALIGLVLLTVVVLVLLLGNFVVALLKDDLPWHDRWARAEVVTAR